MRSKNFVFEVGELKAYGMMDCVKEWKTKQQDLALAQDIINRYCDETGSTEVGIQEVTIMPEGSMQVERAEWVIRLEEALEHKYGVKVGDDITRRVLATLITQGQSLH